MTAPLPRSAGPGRVAGIDGARGGWIVVTAPARGRLSPVSVELWPRLADLLVAPDAPDQIAVDMPIGLLDVAEPGGRACERAARALLGPRRSSVFSAPARATLAAHTYAEALMLNRSGGGPGLSRQAFHLLPKLRELDAVMTPQLQARVREAHPELAFARRAAPDASLEASLEASYEASLGARPLAPLSHPKRTRAGRDERQALLQAAGVDLAALAAPSLRRAQAAPDDILDAAVLMLVARDLHAGVAHNTLDGAATRDGRGLAMEIVF